MEVPACDYYQIKIADSGVKCIAVNGKSAQHFSRPVTLNKLPKLYVVKNVRDIYYVGITTQSITSRLQSGFSAQGEQGYHGYKWKTLDSAELLIWCFPDSTAEQMEAIEGELAYYVRKTTKNWPLFQMEIHFHKATEEERRIARSILDQCLE